MPDEPIQLNDHPSNSEYSPEEEREIVDAAKHDQVALSRLYRQHYSAIYGFVHRRVGNTHDTHDIVSDVFVSMVRYLPGFQWTGAPFRCWLLRIANTQINRWVRRRKLWALFRPFSEQTIDSSRSAEAGREPHDDVRQAILSLPISFQSVIALYYFEEMPVDSIAMVLNCKTGTVKSRLSRGRELLRKKLSPREEVTSNEQRTVGVVSQKVEV